MSPDTDDAFADVGLLAPVWVGTEAEGLTGDRAVAEAMRRFEAALAGALTDLGIAPSVELSDGDTLNVRELAERAVEPGNPTIPLVATLGEDRWIHHGTTSQDVVDTALMLVAARVLETVEADLVALARQLAELVRANRDRPCVARTLSQQAMPTTLGFRVAGWLSGVHDAVRQVRDCQPLPVSLGGPVGTAAAYGEIGPAVVDAVARSLALGAPTASWHTRRTPVLALAAALTTVGQVCGRICSDVLLMSQTEVGEVDDGSGGRSSAMAHKANPTRSLLVVSATRQLPPLLATVAAAGVFGSERPAGEWQAEWHPLRTMLRLAGAAAERTCDVALGMRFQDDALVRNLDLLVSSTGSGTDWVAEQTAHVGVWIDRVLAEHEGLFA